VTTGKPKAKTSGAARSLKVKRMKSRRKANTSSTNSGSKLKFLTPRISRRYELVEGIPSRSEVYVGRVSCSYNPDIELLRSSLVSYILSNFQFEHVRRRDLSIELGLGPHARRIDVAHRLGNHLIEHSLACAEYYSENVISDIEHANVGLLGKITLPIFFLRFTALFDKQYKTFPIPDSSSFVFITKTGCTLSDYVLTKKKPDDSDKSPDENGFYRRSRFKINSMFEFVKELALLRNLVHVFDPTLNVDFDLYNDIPVLDTFLTCTILNKPDSIIVKHSESLPSSLDVTESFMLAPNYQITGIPLHLQGSIEYTIPSSMTEYLGIKYWEALLGQKGITSVSRLEATSVPFNTTRAQQFLNLPEQISESNDDASDE